MAWTAYCKKCGMDVAPGDQCPECGAKLTPASLRVAWCVTRTPARDWMCWNGVMRLALPVFAAGFVLIVLLELATGGPGALQRVLQGSFPLIAGLLLALLTLGTLLVLSFQGEELLDCVLDSKGAHISRYLSDPSPLKLVLRFRSPAMMAHTDWTGEVPILRVDTRDLAWKDVRRVQLWPQKALILFYSPTWWMRVSVQATAFQWDDALAMIREKLGRKKTVALPQTLIAPPKPRKTDPTPVRRPKAAEPPEVSDVPQVPDVPETDPLPPAEPAPVLSGPETEGAESKDLSTGATVADPEAKTAPAE